MKYFSKSLFFITFILGILIIVSPNVQAIKENPYISKVHPLTDKDDVIYFDTKELDGNADTISFEANGISDSEDLYWIPSNTKRNSFILDSRLKGGTVVKVYLNYYKEDEDHLTKLLLDTITVIDKTPPTIKTSDLTVRNTSFNINTEKDAAISATYNNKKIKLKKSSSTKWIAAIPKPLKGKKLVITATDKAGNIKKITKTTTIPYIFLFAYKTQAAEKQVTGSVYDAKSTDKIYLKIGSKTYKGSLKGDSFKIKFGKITTPKNVTIYLKDKFGNILVTEKIRIYKYEEIKIGMTKKQILDSFYGSPDGKSSDRYGKDYYEYWRYDYSNNTTYLNFYNGKLQSVSKYDN